MSNACLMTRLSNAISTAADGNGRVAIDDLRTMGFDDDTLRRHAGDAVRFTMVRETTSIRLELVAGK